MVGTRKKVKKAEPVISYSFMNQVTLLLAFLVAGAFIMYYVPSLPDTTVGLFHRLGSVDFYDIVALMLGAALTVIYLAYYRAKAYFSSRWLVAAVTYNFLILAVKFMLSTTEFAGRAALGFGSLLGTALLISLLYMGALFVLYLLFDGRILSKQLHKALIVSREGKILLAMGMFVCVTVARILIFDLPGLSGTTAATYLGNVFKADSTALSVLLFLMIVAAVEAFSQVRRREDLKPFLVSGLGLILSFHIWWAVFVFRGYK